MATVKFTRALKRFYPDLKPIEVEVQRVSEVITFLEEEYPGLKDYIVDERGHLRKHVNIFVDNRLIKDKEGLSDLVSEDNEVYIMQALSGG